MRFGLLALIVAMLVIQIMAHTHHENFIKKSYRFVRGYPGPYGRWGKGVWGRKNLGNAMSGPTGTGLAGMYGGGAGNFGNYGGNLGNLGGAGSYGNLGGGMGNFGNMGGAWNRHEESEG
jgi:hypothetical protein